MLVIVDFVDGENDGHFRAAEIGGYRLVVEGESRPAVHDIYYGVRNADGDVDLLAYVRPHLVVALEFQPARVYESERVSAPLAVGVHPVSGDPGDIFHNGNPVAHKAVEERGFAHIGATDHCNQRFHISSLRQPPQQDFPYIIPQNTGLAFVSDASTLTCAI